MKFDDSGSKKREKYDFGVIFEVPGPENPPKNPIFSRKTLIFQEKTQKFKFWGRIPMKFDDSGSKKREKYDFGVIFEVPGPENLQKS